MSSVIVKTQWDKPYEMTPRQRYQLTWATHSMQYYRCYYRKSDLLRDYDATIKASSLRIEDGGDGTIRSSIQCIEYVNS